VVVAVLPFGVVPVPLAGAQLTFVDAVLLSTFAAVLARVVFDRWRLPIAGPGSAMVALVAVAIASMLVGSQSTAVSPEGFRRFGKFAVSLLFFLIAGALLTSKTRLTVIARCLMVAGALQGAIGTGLMALSPLSQLTLLSRLQAIGYPGTDILRYVPGPNDTYTDQLRAIGTSVDPNVFGGTLMLALALMVVQLTSPRPVLSRPLLLVMAIPTTTGLLLSLSRASWLGLGFGLALVGLLRYRRILVLGAAICAVMLVTATGQEFVGRFISGFSTADRATAFRFGEYTNALVLLQRYPLLGIGFGNSPDSDVTAGVSSVYLLVGEQTGLLGLLAFLSVLGATWWTGLRGFRHVQDPLLQGLHGAFLAAFSAAVFAGLLDHYFANQAFPHAVALFWLYGAALVAAARLPHAQTPTLTQTTSTRPSASLPARESTARRPIGRWQP
jgi:hypothetical protein